MTTENRPTTTRGIAAAHEHRALIRRADAESIEITGQI
jgi:hypothetical protein